MAARFNLVAMTNSLKQDNPPEGTQGSFRNIGEDEESISSQRSITNRSKTRPLSQEVSSFGFVLLFSLDSDSESFILYCFEILPGVTSSSIAPV